MGNLVGISYVAFKEPQEGTELGASDNAASIEVIGDPVGTLDEATEGKLVGDPVGTSDNDATGELS